MTQTSLPSSSGRKVVAGGARADARALVRHVGVGYFPLAFVGRLPFAMMIVGVLALSVSTSGSVAEAGIVAAAAGIGTAACGPIAGSLADRVGQRRVLLVSGALSILASAALLLLAPAAPLAVVAIVAALVGGTTPQVAPFSRSRLVAVSGRFETPVARDRAMSLVMSYESAVDETSFVIGPVLVGLLTALVAPWAPLALSMALTASIVVAFAVHPTARTMAFGTRTGAAGSTFASAFRAEARLLVVAALLVGAVFGSTLTALTAFLIEHGHGEIAGIVYGAMSVGAIVVALGTAALPRRFGLRARWVVFAALAAAACVGLVYADSISGVALLLAATGVGVGATLVGIFTLGALVAPDGRATTVLTTLQSSLVVGQALAMAAGGALAEAAGSEAGFAMTALIAGAVLVTGLVDRALFGRVSAPA